LAPFVAKFSRNNLAVSCLCSFLLVLTASAVPGRAQDFKLVETVTFKLSGPLAPVGGNVGTLITKVREKDIVMTLSNIAAGGASETQEIQTLIDRSDLSLISSHVNDVVKGLPIRMMDRTTDISVLDGKPTTVFKFREFKDGRPTVTEPFVEFRVADFLSAAVIAADIVHRQEKGAVDLSMLRDRSVSRVIMRNVGTETVTGNRPGTKVLVTAPGNQIGITYTIARTDDGAYYPARISTPSVGGLPAATLDGSPR
jgi:hypothetical protein